MSAPPVMHGIGLWRSEPSHLAALTLNPHLESVVKSVMSNYTFLIVSWNHFVTLMMVRVFEPNNFASTFVCTIVP